MEVADLFVMAMSRYKRQKYDECATLCTEFLQQNPRDQAAWLLKCRALTQKSWVDDLEIQEEGVADLLMGLIVNSKYRRECSVKCSKTRNIFRETLNRSTERYRDFTNG